MDLAQVVADATEAGGFLGFSVNEWLLLIPAVAGAICTVIQTWRKNKGENKLGAVIHGIEHAAEEHPEAAALVKERIQEKATKLAVEASLNKDVKRITKRRQNGGRL